MNRLTIGLVLAALAGTAAYAVEDGPSRRDADGDRTITRAEMQTHAAQTFAAMDANKDGKLDAADREAHQAAMFDKIDTDKNGQISRPEFTAHHQGGHHAEGGEHKGMGQRMGGGKMHRKADADSNGSVTQAEYTAAAMKRFESMDANKDGQVTREERRSDHTAMRGKMGDHAGHQMGVPATPPKPAN